jgi:uncharacterized protein (DUF58 family)
MIPKELLAALKTIEIVTARLANRELSGNYHSSFKGQGLAFREVRPYMPGDDVRTIDWNVSAKMNEPFVKVFTEEREMTVMLAVDLSTSMLWGTRRSSKARVASEVAALLAFSAIRNGDRVGLILGTNEVERIVPPKKGEKHVMRVIREILGFDVPMTRELTPTETQARGQKQTQTRKQTQTEKQTRTRALGRKATGARAARTIARHPLGPATDMAGLIETLTKVAKRRSVAFVVSDFFADGYEKKLALAAAKHDVIPVVLSDPRDKELPDAGLVVFEDLESGEEVCVDTGDSRVRAYYKDQMKRVAEERRQLFFRLGIDAVEIDTAGSYVKPLRDLFARRARRIRK